MRILVATLVALAVVGTACGSNGSDSSSESSSKIRHDISVSSTAFDDGDSIPTRYSCEGDNVSPPLAWRKVPDGTAELAIVVADPDAPSGTFYHWVVTGVAPGRTHLAQGELPNEAMVATSSSGMASYVGMCPPDGDKAHHYRFTVYALTRKLDLPPGTEAKDAVTRIRAAAVGEGTLVGTFARPG